MPARTFYQISVFFIFIFVAVMFITFGDVNLAFIRNYVVEKQYGAYEGALKNSNMSGCLRGAFSHVLVVVTFNFPFYDNIPLLLSFYNKVFGKVVFCGPEPNGGTHRPSITADVGNGYFGYVCMARAIEKYPGFKGYLYVNDDMIVNWWNLLENDLTKVWQGPQDVDFRQTAYGPIVNEQWMWWTYPMGLKACQESYQDLVHLTEQAKPQFDAKGALNTYLKNGNGTARCGKGWSDFFYVPGHMSTTCKHILNIHYKHRLFLEMAVMNVIHSLDYSKNFEIIKGVFLPDLWLINSKDSREFWKVYNTKLTFIHPFKFGFEEYKEMNIALFKNWILEISNSLTNC